jgi:nitrate reductase delta subunit
MTVTRVGRGRSERAGRRVERRRATVGEHAEKRTRVVYLAAAWCLSYPSEELRDRIPLMRAALGEFAGADAPFVPLLEELEHRPLAEAQSQYVQEFDLSRRHALHLSYWTDGDTRRRGDVLAGFKQAYRRHDVLVDTHGELPDYLPMVLEFAATVDLAAGRDLLIAFRPSLELLRLALVDARLPHAGAVAAVCDTLPGESPADRNAVMKLAGYGPPTESVGLEPFDPRLLPLRTT